MSLHEPLVTIVTPSLNQGAYLEETIKSVLEQDYEDIEYMVMDGGSTDNSVEIIRRYENRLAYWESGPDAGQTDAIMRGFHRARGDILAWLNSDDYYLPGTVSAVVGTFLRKRKAVAVYGDCQFLFPDGRVKVKPKIGFDYRICLHSYCMVPQPSMFFLRSAYEAVGGLDRKLSYAMDYDLVLRLAKLGRIEQIKTTLSTYRLHANSKTVAERTKFKPEWRKVRERNGIDYSKPIRRKLISKYYLAVAALRFFLERGVVVWRKEPGKA